MSVLGNRALRKIDSIINRSSDKYRATLNANTHVLDISYRAMLNSIPANYPEADFVEDYNHFILILRSGLRPAKLLSATVKFVTNNANTGTFFVDDPKFGYFVVGTSFNSVRSSMNSLLRAEKDTSLFTRFTSTGASKSNIGHAPTSNLKGAGQSPLKLKLLDLLRMAPSNPAIVNALDQLHNSHETSTSYSVKREDIDITKLNSALGRCAVLVTVQSFEKNNELSKIEASIERELKAYLNTSEFREQFIREKGSNSILEDIEESFKQLVNPKIKKVVLPRHTQKLAETSKSKVDMTGPKKTYVKPTRLRTPTGQFTSLASIQVILNQRLAEQIKANMGKGTAHSILNNRTGRFAESAAVERLAVDRSGVITAFYNYMKYPYQTFEPGNSQGSPKSRDPKLLISKSIREIAVSLATTRLRTVLV